MIQVGMLFVGEVGLRASLDTPSEQSEEVSLELTETEVPDWVEEVFQVVQTNPEVVENTPDETRNIAEVSQQSAQKEDLKTLEKDFASDGELETAQQLFADSPSQAVPADAALVTGPTLPADRPQEPSEEEVAAPLELPTQDYQRKQIFDDEALATDGIDADGDEKNKEEGEAEKAEKIITIGQPNLAERTEQKKVPTWQELAQSRQPQPRPQVDRSLLPYLTRRSAGNVARFGELALEADSRFLQFAKYHRTMMEAIVQQWYNLAEEVNLSSADTGSVVSVSFLLQADGQIEQLEITGTSARNVPTIICKDAIASRVPFAPWNEQMIDILPQPFPLKISFHYR